MCLSFCFEAYSFPKLYKSKFDNHLLYRYDFDISSYKIELIKALDDGKLGLEDPVNASARHKAIAAFNGGFFHDEHRATGTPSFLHISNNNIYAISTSHDAVYLTKTNSIEYGNIKSEIFLISNGKTKISADSINNSIQKGIKIFTTSYWNSTLSEPGTYEIVVVNEKFKTSNFNGNNKIPENGFVISLDKHDKKRLRELDLRSSIDFTLELSEKNKKIDLHDIDWLLSGNNILISNGEIADYVSNPKYASEFRDVEHKRTALCKFSSKDFAAIIADSNDGSDIYDLNINQLVNKLKERNIDRQTALKLSTEELLSKINDSKAQRKEQSYANGISLTKFTNYLKSINCKYAINLDGGRSSNLVVNNKIVNMIPKVNNRSKTNQKLRNVGDIFLIKKM